MIDRWESADAYNAFLAEHQAEYMRRSDESRVLLRAGAALRDVRERLERMTDSRSRRITIRPCWGCGDNPTGLHLPQPIAEGLTEYEAYFAFDERHQGGPGIVHGGLVAGALDEAVGLLATWYAFPTVTARIFVRYRRPVPINTELL